eukprot:3414852-Rhodomonas_salina.4
MYLGSDSSHVCGTSTVLSVYTCVCTLSTPTHTLCTGLRTPSVLACAHPQHSPRHTVWTSVGTFSARVSTQPLDPPPCTPFALPRAYPSH